MKSYRTLSLSLPLSSIGDLVTIDLVGNTKELSVNIPLFLQKNINNVIM